MLIEHTFVTTLESNEALAAASEFLSGRGFTAEAQNAFTVGETGWTTLEMSRGRKASRARNVVECPQRIRLEWDRGRVSVAATIEPFANQNRSFALGGVFGNVGALTIAPSRSTRRTKPHADLMIEISRSLELLLVNLFPPEDAGRDWFAMEDALKEKARRARIRSFIVLGIVLAAIAAIIVISVVAASK